MQTSGFTNTPVSQFLIFWIVGASILASITDTKYYFHISIDPHLSQWNQHWRLLTWQTCYANSTEVLFAAMTFYNLRVIERIWGSKKLASFIIITLPYTLLLPPLLLSLLRLVTINRVQYLPSGPTPILFALLAQYHAAIPSLYTYRLSATPPSASSSSNASLAFTSKSTSYFLPLQLALSQFPFSILPAVTGWVVGYAWRAELLPGCGWRVPGWVVGQERRRDVSVGRVETLRRRMDREEDERAESTGVEGVAME